jgi:hypothetical protein
MGHERIQMANGKWQNSNGFTFAICDLKSPYRFVVLALPFVVATAFDSIARNWFDSSRIADNQ